MSRNRTLLRTDGDRAANARPHVSAERNRALTEQWSDDIPRIVASVAQRLHDELGVWPENHQVIDEVCDIFGLTINGGCQWFRRYLGEDVPEM